MHLYSSKMYRMIKNILAHSSFLYYRYQKASYKRKAHLVFIYLQSAILFFRKNFFLINLGKTYITLLLNFVSRMSWILCHGGRMSYFFKENALLFFKTVWEPWKYEPSLFLVIRADSVSLTFWHRLFYFHWCIVII